MSKNPLYRNNANYNNRFGGMNNVQMSAQKFNNFRNKVMNSQNPQAMGEQISNQIIQGIQNNPQYMEQLNFVRQKYGQDLSPTQLAQAIMQDNGIDPSMFFGRR
jgi:hypothetical protein